MTTQSMRLFTPLLIATLLPSFAIGQSQPIDVDTVILSDITVTARRLPVEIKTDRTIVNLSSSVIASHGNIYDALRIMPGITVQGRGNIIVNGQGGVKVLIDGKETRLSGEALAAYLRGISSSDIDKVEIIGTPSSLYDASGKNGVINIIRKRTSLGGISASAEGGYAHNGPFNGGDGAIAIRIKRKTLSFQSVYSIFTGTDPEEVKISREYASISNLVMRQHNLKHTNYTVHSFRVSTDWGITSNTSLNAYFSATLPERLRDESTRTHLFSVSYLDDSEPYAYGKTRVSERTLRGGIGLTHLNNSGVRWNIGAYASRFCNRDVSQRTFSKTDSLFGLQVGHIDIYSAESGIIYPIGPSTNLSAGIKMSSINVGNSSDYFGSQDLSSLPRDTEYEENIMAAYLQTEIKKLKGWEIDAGARCEFTWSKLISDRTSKVRSNYVDVFPFLNIRYSFNRIHKLSAIYGKRISRPNYRDMDPFITVTDRYLYEKGNPELRPELAHNVDFTYVYRNLVRLSFVGSYVRHPIIKSFQAMNDMTVCVIPMNLSSSFIGGSRIGVANIRPCDIWSFNGNFSITWNKYSYIVNSVKYNSKLVVPIVNMNHRINLPLETEIEISAYWNGKMPLGQSTVSSHWAVSCGLGRNFLKNSLRLRLFAENLLSSHTIRMDVANPTQSGWYTNKQYRRLGISIAYTFHRGEKITKNRQPKESDETKRINR